MKLLSGFVKPFSFTTIPYTLRGYWLAIRWWVGMVWPKRIRYFGENFGKKRCLIGKKAVFNWAGKRGEYEKNTLKIRCMVDIRFAGVIVLVITSV